MTKTLFPQVGRTVSKNARWLLVAAICCGGALAAEGPIVAVQSALIRDKFLTGEASGVHDKATREALQKFQAYHSLPPTGEIDTATLEALQTNVPTKPAPALAVEEPAKAATAQADRQFLEGLVNGQEQTAAKSEQRTTPAPAKGERGEKTAPARASNEPIRSEPARSEPVIATTPAPPSPVAKGVISRVEPPFPAPAPAPNVAVETQKPEAVAERPTSRLRIVPTPTPDPQRMDEPYVAGRVNRDAHSTDAERPTSRARVAPVPESDPRRNMDEPYVAGRVNRDAPTAPEGVRLKSRSRVAQAPEPGTNVPLEPFVGERVTRETPPVQTRRRVQNTPAPKATANVPGTFNETGEPLNPSTRTKTVRTRTTTIGPDGRTYVSETTTTSPAGATPSPEAARKAVEVQRPRKLFDRIHIFHDRDDD